MEYDPATVGKRIEELLNASGMKYMDFAKRLNRSPSAVSAWIRGEELTVELIYRMAALFRVSVDCLLRKETKETVYTEKERWIIESWKMITARDPAVASHLERQLQLLIELVELREKK